MRRSETLEASSLGAAICASIAAGWYSDMAAAAGGMAGRITSEIAPDPAGAARYAELLAIYRGIYPRLRESFSDLSHFARGK